MRIRRALLAAASIVLGWLAGSGVALAVEASTAGRVDTADMLVFLLFIGLFALLAWVASVLPLALFGSHRGWLFRPVAAPAVGAVSGMLLLLLEVWVFFDSPPWAIVAGGNGSGGVYLVGLAAVIGSVTWSAYTTMVKGRWNGGDDA